MLTYINFCWLFLRPFTIVSVLLFNILNILRKIFVNSFFIIRKLCNASSWIELNTIYYVVIFDLQKHKIFFQFLIATGLDGRSTPVCPSFYHYLFTFIHFSDQYRLNSVIGWKLSKNIRFSETLQFWIPVLAQ